MTPEEQLERVRMCIAEAGYDPDLVALNPWNDGFVAVESIPRFVVWRAIALVGEMPCCWPCRREAGYIPPWAERPICTHPVDPFCAEDAEMVS